MNILKKLFERSDAGIDLGAANMRVWVKGKGLVMEEPSAVVLVVSREAVEASVGELQGQQDSKPSGKPCKYRVLAIGAEAGEMIGKTPGSLIVIHPMKGGVICDYDITEKMLRYCFAHQKVRESCKGGFRRPRVMIAVPSGITEVEKRALEDAAHSAGAGEVFLLEASMAAAIGAGIPVTEPKGRMVVDIGAWATNMAIFSLAGIVHSNVLRVGGDEMNNAIIAYLHRKYNLLAGEREAEDVKIKIGTACKPEKELDYEIKGLDATEGRKLAVTVNSKEIREEALAGLLGQIDDALKEFIAHVEPGLAADIADNGIVLTGGSALLPGLDKRLADTTGLPVRVADDPAHATIRGVSVVLDELEFLSKKASK